MITSAFKRAIAMAQAISAAMSLHPLERQIALDGIGQYKSRGKGGKQPHRATGIAGVKRAAKKARNVKRSRAAGK